MKLLCVNDQTIETTISKYDGRGLRLGFVFTTNRPMYENAESLDCYHIEELGEGKLACRFSIVDDDAENADEAELKMRLEESIY